jgi:hypothetical protein
MTRCWISIGSNQDRERAIPAAIAALRASSVRCCSRIYETAAVGFDGDPFYNLVAGIDTDLPVAAIVERLRAIEDANGRVRGGRALRPAHARSRPAHLRRCGRRDRRRRPAPRRDPGIRLRPRPAGRGRSPPTAIPCAAGAMPALWAEHGGERLLRPVSLELTAVLPEG